MIKRILLYLYGEQSQQACISAATQFAQHHEASLTACYVGHSRTNVHNTAPGMWIDADYATNDKRAETLKAKCEEQCEKYSVSFSWYDAKPNESRPQPLPYSDMIFASQPDMHSDTASRDLSIIDNLINESGLAIVLVPKNWDADTLGATPVLGWKESPQAVGVVRLALPLMRSSDNLDIVTVNSMPDHDEEVSEGMEIGKYLAAHGVTCQFYARRPGGADKAPSDTLLRHAVQYSRDLIIIGGYSHSRFREMLAGGMTRDLIKNSTVPIMLAH